MVNGARAANILLHQGIAKISDFGLSRPIQQQCMDSPLARSSVGSPLYMAPQLLSSQVYSSKCDIWSLGILFYEMLFGQPPWNGETELLLLKNIMHKQLKFPETPVLHKSVKSLIKNMLKYDEPSRYSWKQLFDNPILSGSAAPLHSGFCSP